MTNETLRMLEDARTDLMNFLSQGGIDPEGEVAAALHQVTEAIYFERKASR